MEAVTLKGGSGNTVIYEELRVFVTVSPGIVRKNLLLIGDGIGFLSPVIVH